MLVHKNTILNKNINVNGFNQFKYDLLNDDDLFNELVNNEFKENSFNEFIKENDIEKIAVRKYDEKYEYFFCLIPKIQMSAVLWNIKNIYKGNVQSFIRDRKVFIKNFNIKLRDICDENITLKDEEKRNKKKLRKEALLYSSQLLGLVGRNGEDYLNQALLDDYVNEQEEQENFLKGFRLINSNGKIFSLITAEKKKEKQLAQTLNISSALARIAEDRGFIYSLVTLTLPGRMHCSPKNGRALNDFSAIKPLQALQTINKFWVDIRANLAKKGLRSGIDFFGAIVFEGMKSSTPHKHILIYSSPKNQTVIHEVIKDVENRARIQLGVEILNFDISEYDESKGASGATYIFKYITKSGGGMYVLGDDGKPLEDSRGNLIYKDEVALKNIALRSFYSARSFEFFGIKKTISKFNFLLTHYKDYQKCFSIEIQNMFNTYDYYSFITIYEKYFKSVRSDKKTIKFVLFDVAGNIKDFPKVGFLKKQILIEKKIFSIFETNEYITDNKIEDIKNVEEDRLTNKFAYVAFNDVKEKQKTYNLEILDFISKYSLSTIKRLCDINSTDYNFLLVTLKESYSRKSEKAKTKDKEKPKINDES